MLRATSRSDDSASSSVLPGVKHRDDEDDGDLTIARLHLATPFRTHRRTPRRCPPLKQRRVKRPSRAKSDVGECVETTTCGRRSSKSLP